MNDLEPPQQAELACWNLKPSSLAKLTHISCLLGCSAQTHMWTLFLLSQNHTSRWLPHPWGGTAVLPHQQFKQAVAQMEMSAQSQIQSFTENRFRLCFLFARGMKTAQAFILFHHLRQDAFLGWKRWKDPDMKGTLSCLASRYISSCY